MTDVLPRKGMSKRMARKMSMLPARNISSMLPGAVPVKPTGSGSIGPHPETFNSPGFSLATPTDRELLLIHSAVGSRCRSPHVAP